MMEQLTRPVPAVVQQIEQDQQRTWDEIVDEIAQLALSEDETALQMGDRFLELEQRFGSKHLKKAAEDACVTWSLAKLRLWVSRKIPTGHPIRDSRLSFNHLAAIAGTDNMEHWTNVALKEQLSVAKLREAINVAGDNKAQEQGEPCLQCEKPLPKTGDIVAFTVGKEPRRRLCNVECAMHYFVRRTAEREDLLAQMGMESLPVLDPKDPTPRGCPVDLLAE